MPLYVCNASLYGDEATSSACNAALHRYNVPLYARNATLHGDIASLSACNATVLAVGRQKLGQAMAYLFTGSELTEEASSHQIGVLISLAR